MHLPIVIGKNSDNKDHIVDLAMLPHLFISYCETMEMQKLFKSFIKGFTNNRFVSPIKVAYAFSQDTVDSVIKGLPNDFVYSSFIKNHFEKDKVNSNSDFVVVLNKELKKRISLLNKSKVSTITDYNKPINNNKLNKLQQLPYIIVFVEDIFDMVLTSRKKTGLYFIQLALLGNQYGIHIIAASSSTYRNLLSQLINIHPSVQKELKAHSITENIRVINPLGAELTTTVEGLLFFKEIGMLSQTRLFPTNVIEEYLYK